jgi:hypothetical protein
MARAFRCMEDRGKSMKKIFLLLVALVGGFVWLNRIARRSGLKNQDMSRSLPGDELLPHAQFVMDRATTFNASADQVWQWIIQLGKDRGGWYVPSWLERLTRGTLLSGIRSIDPQFQQLRAGDFVPEYGPGSPLFKVMQIEPPNVLVYLSLRDPSANWGWPSNENALPKDAFAFSWSFMLEELESNRCRLQIRFRGQQKGNAVSRLFYLFGGLIDYLTIALMFAGLRERLQENAHHRFTITG